MATWEDQTSPLSKFESSPAESFISAPGEMYPSLFASSPTPSTMDPLEMMTPPPLAEEMNSDPDAALVSALAATVPSSTPSTTPTASKLGESEKRPTKKRKSWGQVLPQPKTNLPPRKRAKTEDEKEQRRVERVLRNRRAAQSSRERKRQEVDALEKRNQELEARLLSMEKYSIRLLDELRVYRQTSGVVTRTSSPFDTLQTDSVTLSKELFSSQDGHQPLLEPNPHLNGLDLEEPSNPTVNPSSLSPKPAPNTETGTDTAPEAAIAFKATSADASSTDLTQRPAVSAVGGSASDLGSFAVEFGASDADCHSISGFDMSAPSDPDRFVFESGLLSSGNSVDFENDHLDGDSTSFHPTDSFDDIMQFLNEDGNQTSHVEAGNGSSIAAESDPSHPFADFENPFSSEAFNQQPQSGASAQGCDDGGLAVGGI